MGQHQQRLSQIQSQNRTPPQLFAKDDKGFVGDTTTELNLIDAMKRGSFMTVKAKTKDGRETSDTYSLIGATAAVNSLAKGCS